MTITFSPLWRLWIIVFGGHFICQLVMDSLAGHWWRSLLAGAALGSIVSVGHFWLERTSPTTGEKS